MIRSQQQFIRELGYAERDGLYRALMFQPRAVGALVLAGAIVQQAWVFVALSAVLWWSALFPASNPFDAIYNTVVARPMGRQPLAAAPAPRRFAADMAGTFALAIALALGAGVTTAAWVLEGVFGASVLAVLFLRFCAPAVLHGRLLRLREI